MAKGIKQDIENLLIEVGHELFWKFGFKKVTVEDVCKKAGVSKMSFYRYFGNKTDLAKRVLDKVLSEGIEKFRIILTDDDTIANKMHRFIALKMEGTNDISKEFVEDLYTDIGSEIQLYMAQRSTEAWVSVMEEFRAAQSRGVFRSDFKPEILFAMSKDIAEIVTNPALNSLYANTQEVIVEWVNLITFGIAPRDENTERREVTSATNASEEKCQTLDK
ncbi:MAG: TetR/AcrR family transcriptional regulator [Bacteroidales bacterium]|jgi:AcrR family transcriptional regulator|nr:TetR/AcrR family transcriptional regulator [Bacteroidales bacterium]